jgi:hypothetical protein
MNERTPFPAEKFPSEGEVMRIMEHIFKGGNFTEVEREENEDRLTVLTFEGVDSEGDRLLYEYYASSNTGIEPVIHVVFHDKEDVPCGGHNVANFANGSWKINGIV